MPGKRTKKRAKYLYHNLRLNMSRIPVGEYGEIERMWRGKYYTDLLRILNRHEAHPMREVLCTCNTQHLDLIEVSLKEFFKNGNTSKSSK